MTPVHYIIKSFLLYQISHLDQEKSFFQKALLIFFLIVVLSSAVL